MRPSNMWEVKAEVNFEQAEALDEFLTESEVEGWHLYSNVDTRRAWLTGYFESEEKAGSAWGELEAMLPAEIEVGAAESRALEDDDWQNAYKAHFHRWEFEGLHWVPVWDRESFVVPEGDQVVWLDPGMAFGTGNHETTRLCVERLLECRREWEAQGRNLGETEVLDAGCGSGILAISAAKCGFVKVAGFDVDPVAVAVSEENAELNDLAGRIEFYEADLITGLRERKADLLLANILANVLCEHAARLVAAVKPGGRLVLSGILATECEQVEACFRNVLPAGRFSSRQLEEWSDLLVIVPE